METLLFDGGRHPWATVRCESLVVDGAVSLGDGVIDPEEIAAGGDEQVLTSFGGVVQWSEPILVPAYARALTTDNYFLPLNGFIVFNAIGGSGITIGGASNELVVASGGVYEVILMLTGSVSLAGTRFQIGISTKLGGVVQPSDAIGQMNDTVANLDIASITTSTIVGLQAGESILLLAQQVVGAGTFEITNKFNASIMIKKLQ